MSSDLNQRVCKKCGKPLSGMTKGKLCADCKRKRGEAWKTTGEVVASIAGIGLAILGLKNSIGKKKN